MTPRHLVLAIVAVPLLTVAASPYVAWEDLTESDWLFGVATRVATVDGMQVHYPTPTKELVAALESRTEVGALRQLAEARRDLGDTQGALAALDRWAEAEGAHAWAEAARWAAAQGQMPFAFRAAEKALPQLSREEARGLMNERIGWAERAPGHVDPLTLRESRAREFPGDARIAEDWIRALERAGRLTEATAALGLAKSLSRERRILLASDLAADHGESRKAQEILDASLEEPVSPGSDVARAFAQRTDAANSSAPQRWRASLDRSFDPRSLVRLTTYFEGKEQGDAALELLRQVERRHSAAFDRPAWLLISRLYLEIDAVSEAFRARLAASHGTTAENQQEDLASLATLALAAGSRALPIGLMSDAHYAWVATMDRTPGFWTGGLSLLLTGEDWPQALAEMENEALPERTFAAARFLVDELARRAPTSPEISALRVAIMRRHVERGEGEKALALLPLVEGGSADVVEESRRQALLALRQVERPIALEARLFAARLRHLAPDATKPLFAPDSSSFHSSNQEQDGPDGTRVGAHSTVGFLSEEDAASGQAWTRYYAPPDRETYEQVLAEAIARLDQRDRTHRAAVGLILGEMDRLPESEALWNRLADRLQEWNLDDDLGPRFERALQRFEGPGIWPRLARWYTRRSRHAELRRLADDLTNRFRGSSIFSRTQIGPTLEIAEQPKVGSRVRLVSWADWVRLRALERFPHSPTVYREAATRLVRQSRSTAEATAIDKTTHRVVVDDTLMDARRAAILFVDDGVREEYMAEAMRKGLLATRLTDLEKLPSRTAVEDRLLFDGWSRLSEFERAAPFAVRLAAQYPGDQKIAASTLSLLRSLVSLRAAKIEDARDIVESAARASLDPTALYTELGEIEMEAGRADAAVLTWKRILERESANPRHIESVATLLWDYDRPAEAKAIIDAGRTSTGRRRLLAFEAGVLREQLRDIDGAVREYLAAAEPDGTSCFCSWFDRDQRALRRLSQLMARERVLSRILTNVESLPPGSETAEQTLIALLPLARIDMPEEGYDFTADDWIDGMDAPNDPVGREERQAARKEWRPAAREGMSRVGSALFTRTLTLVGATKRTAFLDAVEGSSWSITSGRTTDESFGFRAALLERRAALAPTEEERVDREVARARFLLDGGKPAEADAVWTSLASRVAALPQGLSRLKAEAARAAYLERTSGPDSAAREWERLTSSYPWSLGLLEDRLALLQRAGRGDEARAILEKVAPTAARGHREALLERLTREALEARALPQARRAVEMLLETPDLPVPSVLGGTHLLVRLALRETPEGDMVALVRSRETSVPKEQRADLYAEAARGASAERAWTAASDLWIEALNRRLERTWIREGFLASDHARRADAFRTFFEKQQQRSPRDVRWAVAVREIRRLAGDVAGAMEMARVAVSVRPERESLWMEAVDILTRAGRFREAADYLAGWQETRKADADIAARRAALFVRAGDPAAALAVEREALDAFVTLGPMDEERTSERDSRIEAMAHRFMALGLPREAWKALAIPGDPKASALDSLGATNASRLALATGRFTSLLARKASEDDWHYGLASAVSTSSASQKDEVLRFLVETISPYPTPPRAKRVAALRKYWSFASDAGLEEPLRMALARRSLEGLQGPWTAEQPADFVGDVGASIVDTTPDEGPALVDTSADLERLWVRELVRRDRPVELYTLLEARWTALVAQAQATTPLPARSARPAWTRWLDDPKTMDTFLRGASTRPQGLEVLSSLVAGRRTWDRLWSLAARSDDATNVTAWPVHIIVASLPEEARAAWFRTWQTYPPNDRDPVVAARGRTIEAAQRAIVRLASAKPLGDTEEFLARLRGPRTVGEVLSDDGRWTFPEFALRKDAKANTIETGDDRLVGHGKDALRVPGTLWGPRPSSAWYALETLARVRERDPLAPLVPLEVPERGRESDRLLVAMDAASALGDAPLALELDRAAGGIAGTSRLERRLRLLIEAGRREEALTAFTEEVRRAQPQLKEATFRSLRRLGEDLGLGDATQMLDLAHPVDPSLLAHLVDRHGPVEAGRRTSFDAAGFRSALSIRWQQQHRLGAVPLESVRFYLSELWARDAAPFPSQRVLRRLGPFWEHAAPVLTALPLEARAEGLAATASLPDDAALEALVRRLGLGNQESVLLLRLRIALAAGRTEEAKKLVLPLLDAEAADRPLAWVPVPPAPYRSRDEDVSEGEESPEVPTDRGDTASRLARWLAPFSQTHQVALVAERYRETLAVLRERDPGSEALWRLSFEVASDDAQRSTLANGMDRAWLSGSWDPDTLGPIVEMVAGAAPTAATPWLDRWNAGPSWNDTERKARILATLGRKPEAARHLVLAKKQGGLSWESDRQAFDAWRRLGPQPPDPAAPAPPDWAAALPFWTERAEAVGPDLARHLRKRPLDVLAARAALRTVAPGDLEAMRLASRALAASGWSETTDDSVLDLRAARSELVRSWRSARPLVGESGSSSLASDLTKRRFPSGECRAAIADVVRTLHRAGEARAADGLVSHLEDDNPEEAKALRSALATEARAARTVPTYRMVGLDPAPYRPRDLDWAFVSSVLAVEVAR